MVQQKLVSSEKTEKTENVYHGEPQLRFREFKDSWKKIKVKDITNSITKGTTPKKYSDEGINFIKVENIENNKIVNINSWIDEDTHNIELNRSILEENDLLFSIAGTLGRTAKVTKDILPANTNQALSIIKIKNLDENNVDYIQTRLNCSDIEKYIFQNLAVGAQPNLNLKQVGNIEIRLPSRVEQDKIQNFVSSINKKIELLEKKLVLYHGLELNLKNKIFNSFNNGSFVKLKDICLIKKGKQLNKSDMVENGKYYVLNGGKEPSGYTNSWNVKENTVTISEGGNSCGFVSFNNQKFYCGGHCYYLTLKKDNFDLNYLFHYLKHLEPHIMRLRVGSGLPNIQKGDIENITILEVDFNKQKEIGDFLESFNNMINLIFKEKEELEIFKKGLLQKMFI